MNIGKLNTYNLKNNPTYTAGETTRPDEIELVSTRKAKPVFDINKELANQTFIRPLPPKGHIVRTGILDAPKTYFKDIMVDIKALKDAARGDANDHQLGKLNDLGLKLGGLSIAGYLVSVRKAPVAKWMEFVGLGSFLASMALWPRLALELPCRVLHGFNPFMKYEDSRGCKKPFFQDNQYIPFDMLSDKDINRIGNKLGVPENLFNRRDAVQEKMRQIALQNNTMWMLTAGFATPVMSALMCNVLEPVVDNVNNFFMNRELNGLLEDFNKHALSNKNNHIAKGINAVYSKYGGKPMTDSIKKELIDILASDMDPSIRRGVEKDFNNIFKSGFYTLSPDVVPPLKQAIEQMLAAASKNKILYGNLADIVPSETQILAKFETGKYLEKTLDEFDINNLKSDLTDIIKSNIQAVEARGAAVTPYVKRNLTGCLFDNENPGYNDFSDVFKSVSTNVLNDKNKKVLLNFADLASQFAAENKVLNTYAFKRLAQAPNTSKAKFWNDTLDSVIKMLKITPEEISKSRFDRKLTGKLLNEKIWQVATSDTQNYTKFVEELASKISLLEKEIKPEILTGKYVDQLKQTLEISSDKFRSQGFNHTADKIFVRGQAEAGTLLGVSKTFVEDTLQNVKNTFSAILNKVSVYRTVYNAPDLNFLEDSANIPQELKEEIMAAVEYLTTEGRISDYSVKLEFLRNLHPNTSVGQLEMVEGKGVKYKFYNAAKLTNDGVFIPNDDNFFKRVMKTIFDSPIGNETSQVLAKYPSVEKMLNDYRHNMYYEVGNAENFMYPDRVVSPELVRNPYARYYSTATPKFKSLAAGSALDEMFATACRQKYNTRKWLKMFGGFGAGLLAFTVLTQFTFGHGPVARQKKGNA